MVGGGGGGYDEYNLGVCVNLCEFLLVRVLTCALTCPIHVTLNPTDIPSPGTSLRTPGDRQHVDKQAFPWHPSTKGQTTHAEDMPSPGTLFRVHQGTDYTGTQKPSPGTHFSFPGQTK